MFRKAYSNIQKGFQNVKSGVNKAVKIAEEGKQVFDTVSEGVKRIKQAESAISAIF